MRDHTEIEELLALEALGGLEPDDRARLHALRAEHGPDCVECAELRAGFADTAAMLGTGLAPTPVSAGLEAQTIIKALDDAPTASDGPAKVDGGAAAIAPTHRWRNALIAIAAAIVLVAVGALGGYLAAPRNPVESFLGQEGVQIVPFAPSDGTGGAMTLAVGPDGTTGYVLGSGLDAPPAGKTLRTLDDHRQGADLSGLRRPDRRTGRVARHGFLQHRRRRRCHRRVEHLSQRADHVTGAGRDPLTWRTTRFRLALSRRCRQDARGFGLARPGRRHGAGTCRRRYLARW